MSQIYLLVCRYAEEEYVADIYMYVYIHIYIYAYIHTYIHLCSSADMQKKSMSQIYLLKRMPPPRGCVVRPNPECVVGRVRCWESALLGRIQQRTLSAEEYVADIYMYVYIHIYIYIYIYVIVIRNINFVCVCVCVCVCVGVHTIYICIFYL
jgi:hypothetical protein